jgi:SAM-dependent methyltransferase
VGESIRFDRAAEFYDQTRVTSEDAMARTVEVLGSELRGRGRVLEIGIGTGLLALPLHRAGVRVAGLDISAPMLGKLVEKAGGDPPIPLVLGDATRLPFVDGAFGAAYLRWVLHLVPAWREAVAEVVRVVTSGGVVLVNHGGFSGVGLLIRSRMEELVGRTLSPVGLDWSGWRELQAEMGRLGARHRELPPIVERGEAPLATDVDGIAANRYSWTWNLSDDERLQAAAELRPWLEERFGDLHAPHPLETEIVWHAYDLP